MSTATLTSKGQTTIPKDVREKLGLQAGDTLHFNVLSDGSVSMRVKRGGILDLAGLLQRPGQTTITVDQMKEGVLAATARKYKRKLKP